MPSHRSTCHHNGGSATLKNQLVGSEALTGQHLAQLQAALLDAFSFDELAKMVRLELNYDLPAVVPVQGRTLDAITYDLVVWALRKPEVGLQGLLAAAYRANPQNPRLQQLQTAWAELIFAPPACPYPGMRPFTAVEKERFYGRSGEVRQGVDALRRYPFLAVIGPSGSGKSSLPAHATRAPFWPWPFVLKPLQMLVGHTGGVSSIAFNADGTTLASGSGDNTVRRWNVSIERLISKAEAHIQRAAHLLTDAERKELGLK